MEKKMTKKDYFNALLEIGAVASNDGLVEFINHEIELLDKKNASSKKPSKTQLENEVIKNDIVNALINLAKPARINDLVAELQNQYSNQKISALVKQLVDSGKVVKSTDKKVSTFTLAE